MTETYTMDIQLNEEEPLTNIKVIIHDKDRDTGSAAEAGKPSTEGVESAEQGVTSTEGVESAEQGVTSREDFNEARRGLEKILKSDTTSASAAEAAADTASAAETGSAAEAERVRKAEAEAGVEAAEADTAAGAAPVAADAEAESPISFIPQINRSPSSIVPGILTDNEAQMSPQDAKEFAESDAAQLLARTGEGPTNVGPAAKKEGQKAAEQVKAKEPAATDTDDEEEQMVSEGKNPLYGDEEAHGVVGRQSREEVDKKDPFYESINNQNSPSDRYKARSDAGFNAPGGGKRRKSNRKSNRKRRSIRKSNRKRRSIRKSNRKNKSNRRRQSFRKSRKKSNRKK